MSVTLVQSASGGSDSATFENTASIGNLIVAFMGSRSNTNDEGPFPIDDFTVRSRVHFASGSGDRREAQVSSKISDGTEQTITAGLNADNDPPDGIVIAEFDMGSPQFFAGDSSHSGTVQVSSLASSVPDPSTPDSFVVAAFFARDTSFASWSDTFSHIGDANAGQLGAAWVENAPSLTNNEAEVSFNEDAFSALAVAVFTFSAGPPWTLGVDTQGEGSVVVEHDNVVVDPSTYEWPDESQATLTAVPDSGWAGTAPLWTGNVPASNENDQPLTLTMDESRIVSCHFVEVTVPGPVIAVRRVRFDGQWWPSP